MPTLPRVCESIALGHSEREDADLGEWRGEALNVFGVSGGNDSGVELKGRRDDERIDDVSRGKLRLGEQVPCALGDLARQVGDANPGIVEEPIDWRVVARARQTSARTGAGILTNARRSWASERIADARSAKTLRVADAASAFTASASRISASAMLCGLEPALPWMADQTSARALSGE